MKKRTRLLSAICILAVILGIWAVADSVRGIVYPFNPSEETLTERQQQTVQQIKAILDPWQPIETALLLLNSVKGALLVVAGIAAFRLHPAGRKLLMIAISVAIATDVLGLIWFIGTSAATFEINLYFMTETYTSITKAPPSPSYMRNTFIGALAVAVVLRLFKMGLEAAAWNYLRSDAIRQLFSIRPSRGERVNDHENGNG